MSQAKLQAEVSTRVLKLAQQQNQPAAQLLDAAIENVQEIVSAMADGAGGNLDTTA